MSNHSVRFRFDEWLEKEMCKCTRKELAFSDLPRYEKGHRIGMLPIRMRRLYAVVLRTNRKLSDQRLSTRVRTELGLCQETAMNFFLIEAMRAFGKQGLRGALSVKGGGLLVCEGAKTSTLNS